MTDEPDQLAVPHPDTAVPARNIELEAANREAFSTFYREFVPRLVALLIAKGARPADAADIAQDTMMKLWRHWSTITSPKAWTRTVAGRELARRIGAIDEDLIAEPERSALLPSASDIDEWIQSDDYYRVLATLPPRQRQVLAWTMDGYKPAEIAEELHLKPQTVRSNLRNARRTIATQLNRSADQ
ncbi:sigma-70 family RNA polymerase sigma factor [Nocardia nova]|uniref:RNA polymerase sigma factor n=1 Tax=Nocardia nova TaxID=37330 RepID=UPI000CE9DD74|nr:RNA polymerase sigma factor [Nocardia nova]PPJ05434.1 sigma-70 family RNA polymerase sigma factor [Nocardia nova]